MLEFFRNIFFKEKKIDKNLETNVRYLEYICLLYTSDAADEL